MALEATETYSDWTLVKAKSWKATRGFFISGAETDDEAIAGCPVQPGYTHPNNSRLIAKQLAVSKSARHYKVIVSYDFDKFTVVDDPLDAPLRLTWGDDVESVPMSVDVRGFPVLNPARTPYNPLPTRPDGATRLTVVRNEPFFNVSGASAFKRRVNSNPFSITGPGGFAVDKYQCCCVNICAAREYEIGASYVPVAYEFLFRGTLDSDLPDEIKEDPFQVFELAKGTHGYFAGLDGKPTRGVFCTAENGVDTAGTELTAEVLLDPSGKPVHLEGEAEIFVLSKGIAKTPVAAPPLTKAPSVYALDQLYVTKLYRFRATDFSTLGL